MLYVLVLNETFSFVRRPRSVRFNFQRRNLHSRFFANDLLNYIDLVKLNRKVFVIGELERYFSLGRIE